jgi:hypothetical protein
MVRPGGCFWKRRKETLSEPTILLCGPALDDAESAASLEMLRRVALPGAAKFLVTTGKFDTEGAAKGVNVEANYPAETAYLQTLLRWSETGGLADPRFRDGYDLYCLRRILARHGPFDFAVVLRGDTINLEASWPELRSGVDGRMFLTFGDEASLSLLFDLQDSRASAFLDTAWQLYVTGAVYGIEGYALDRSLDLALEAIELERSIWKCTPSADSAGRPAGRVEASLVGSGHE